MGPEPSELRQPLAAPDGPSDEGDNSSDEDDLPRPDMIGAAVPGLMEQGTRRPGVETLLSYRAYRLVDSRQRANALVSGKINAKLKRLSYQVE
jgi:hypothetical protein